MTNEMNICGFIADTGNYDERMVDRTKFDWGYISTARVSDGKQPLETAVCSNEYAKAEDLKVTSEMVVVEAYDDQEAAQEGHDRWVKIMTENLPKELIDCNNSAICQLGEAFGIEWKEVRIVKNNE